MKRIWLANAAVYTPEGVIAGGSLLVEEGVIREIRQGFAPEWAEPGDEVEDVQGLRLVPGFIDVHVHGGGGADVMAGDAGSLDRISRFHASRGTTAFLPTTLTDTLEKTEQAIAAVVRAVEQGTGGAEIAGIHLEGPFLNPLRCGAQNPELIRPADRIEMQRCVELAGGLVKLVTIAPELDGAEAVIAYCLEQGIRVSIGHSDASSDEVRHAVQLGVSHVTHMFNGMRSFHHRDPGAAGAAMLLDELTTEVICDGKHVAPDNVALLFKVKPRDRVVLITDAVSAAGLPDGPYTVGALPVVMKDGEIRLTATGGLAGSCLTMDQALVNAMQYTGMSLAQLLPALTSNPARQCGLLHRKGSIEAGKDADLVVLDEEYKVVSTYVRGRKVYSREAGLFYSDRI